MQKSESQTKENREKNLGKVE